MDLVIKDYHEMKDAAEARTFLEAAPFHFLCSEVYLPEGFPPRLCAKVVVRGRNRRVDYMHVPKGAGPAIVRALCQLAMQEKQEEGEINLGQFLQGFLGQLKDKVDLREVASNIALKVSELFDAEGASILIYDETKRVLRFAAIHTDQSEVATRLKDLEIPLGQGVAGWVAENQKPQLVNKTATDPRFDPSVDQKTTFETRDLLAAPVLLGQKLVGVLEVVNRRRQPFCEYDIPTLTVLASVVAIFLEKAHLTAERKKHLATLGKAEVANTVLHNIGNVLNSLTVSCEGLQSRIAQSQIKKLKMTSQLINEHEASLGEFFDSDPRGKMVPQFLSGLARHLELEQENVAMEVEKIADRTHLMKDIIQTQQTIARSGCTDTWDMIGIIEEALVIVADTIHDHGVAIVRDFHADRPVRGSRSKLVHIVINLVKNAVEAVANLSPERRIVRLETREATSNGLQVLVSDQGYGISKEARRNLFNHGFTTKDDGHGFGLHSCAKAMEEMNGHIEAHSDGPNKGATFVLSFPAIDKGDLVDF